MYGGEGVGWVQRYLWYIPYTENAKMETLQERTKWKKEEEEDPREASR